MKLSCQRCNAYMGEIIKGKIHNKVIILCYRCWDKAKLAMDMADMAVNQGKTSMPQFFDKLFDKCK